MIIYMEILGISLRNTHFDIMNSLKFHYVMSLGFQIYLQTNKDITTPNTVILFWTSFAPCELVFSNCDSSDILTKARVGDYTELTERHKMKALHIMFLS